LSTSLLLLQDKTLLAVSSLFAVEKQPCEALVQPVVLSVIQYIVKPLVSLHLSDAQSASFQQKSVN
jgi:hypothetical protein